MNSYTLEEGRQKAEGRGQKGKKGSKGEGFFITFFNHFGQRIIAAV
ncbi:MAG: hypothetical protein F6K39_11985 [Okeania sp. SIO3B3]|nr:hypothetical protein [Okeania sp. SIO3B3]